MTLCLKQLQEIDSILEHTGVESKRINRKDISNSITAHKKRELEEKKESAHYFILALLNEVILASIKTGESGNASHLKEIVLQEEKNQSIFSGVFHSMPLQTIFALKQKLMNQALKYLDERLHKSIFKVLNSFELQEELYSVIKFIL